MTSRLDPVLQAISPPKFDDAFLHRESLVDRIFSSLNRKLIAVIAAAGYGKTTLLADFIEHSEFPVVFLRLSNLDIDPEQLAILLSASLKRRFRRLSGKLSAVSSVPQHPVSLARSFHQILDEHVPEPFLIIIDDIHYINQSDAALEFLNALILEAHDRITFVISGRSLPEIDLGKLVVEGQMTGIGPDQLAFDRFEIMSLVEGELNQSLSDAQLDQLLTDTGGWIAGIRLTALLHKTSLHTINLDRDLMYEYLADEVFAEQAEDMQEFMQGSAVLPFMDPDICDRLLGIEDSAKKLTRLSRQGIFIHHGTGDEYDTYVFQVSFRKFLIERLMSRDPSRYRALCAQAAGLLKDIGAVEYAVNLYFDAGQPDLAAALINDSAADFHHMGRLQTLREWASRLHADPNLAPDLFLSLAALHIDRGELGKASAELDLIRDRIGALPEEARESYRIRILILQGWIYLHQSDIERTLNIATQLDEALDDTTPAQLQANHLRIKGLAHYHGAISTTAAERFILQAIALMEEHELDEYVLAHTYRDLCALQMDLGKEGEAYHANQRAYEIFQEQGSPADLAISLNNQGMIEYVSGRYEAALDLFQEGLKYAHQANNLNSQAILFSSQADLFNDAGLISAAGDLYERALQSVNLTNNPSLHGYICTRVAALHRRNSASGSAEEWLARAAEKYSAGTTPKEYDIEHLALACHRSPVTALHRLDPEDNDVRPQIRYLLAVAHHHLGDHEQAEDVFESVLQGILSKQVLQWLAAELLHNLSFYEELKSQKQPHPNWTDLERRIEYLSVFSDGWQPPDIDSDQRASLVMKALGQSLIEKPQVHVEALEPLHRRLLFYIVELGPVERDVILEDFWPDLPPGRQTASLYTALHGLRAALGDDILDTQGSLYQLNPDLPAAYDVHEFERLVSLAEAMPVGDPRRYFAFREAIQIYTGPFLPEFVHDWVLQRRRSLELLQVDTLRKFSEAAAAKGRFEEARRALQAALLIEPFHDDLHHQYLSILGALGLRSEIVMHYQQYVRQLRDELGLDPPTEMRQLYEKLIS